MNTKEKPPFAVHNQTAIVITEGGKFSAVVGANTLQSSSLAGIKKQIDKAVASAFSPFDAVVVDSRGYGDERRLSVRQVRVVGRREPRRGDGAWGPRWVTEGNEEFRSVVRATPAAIKAAQEYVDHENESARIARERGMAADAMKTRLGWITPDSAREEK